MKTAEQLITQFENYSDPELFEMLDNIEGYSDDAKTALKQVIEKKVE